MPIWKNGDKLLHMSNEIFTLPGSGGITIQGSAADALIRAKSGDAALIYICMLRNSRGFTAEEAAKALGSDDINRAIRALDTLRSLGLIAGSKTEPKEPEEKLPQYTYGDIKRELENGAVFPGLVEEVQRVLNRILSSEDLIKLFGIYDSLGLPPEVVLQLVNYCARLVRERYGANRQVQMRLIEKEAYAWERAELFTIERAEEYIRHREEVRSKTGEFQRMLQISGRRMSPSERSYVEQWIEMGFTVEAAELAYDKTIMKTGKLSWRYMDAIMKDWHEKGLHTLEQLRPKDKPVYNNTQTAENDDYQRMKRMLDDLKGV